MEVPADRDVHTTLLKVRFYELDPYDHVNHTVYFSYFQTARIEYLSESGFGLDQMKKQGWQLVLVEAKARFLAAVRYGEELTIHAWVNETGRVKSVWEQVMLRGDEELAHLQVMAAFTDLGGKPRRVPEEFEAHLSRLQAS